MKLEWRWKCKPSTNNKKTTSDILDFLMDANIRLSVRFFVLLLIKICSAFTLKHAPYYILEMHGQSSLAMNAN